MTRAAPSPDVAQRKAADPAASAWVTASAGTGKTKVLTDRALRLLLRPGTRPSSLLLLTFTRAAAAEMDNRLAVILARWASADDAALEGELAQLLGARPDAGVMARARRLFAAVLDAPGGLAIETIHGFCQSLLRRFPLEAGVPPHFRVMEERDAAEMMSAAREEMLTVARADAAAPLARALAAVTALAGEEPLGTLMHALSSERSRLARLEARHGTLAGAALELRRRLGLGADETEAAIVAAACRDESFDPVGLRAALDGLVEGGTTDAAHAAAMEPWLAADAAARARGFDVWCRCFLTKEGQPFARLCSKDAEKARQGTMATMAAEAARLVAANERRKAARTAEATSALLALAGAQIELYRRHKEAEALLDYDDLILRAGALLGETAPAWVHYKLDQGIDHVLIDEAQDTNPEQWQVVDRLTSEFFAGRGTREEGSRTLFAVGDAKQSIFAFQRADPAEFVAMRERLRGAVPSAGGRWEEVTLDTSFRSTAPVLAAVDLVFGQADAGDGVVEPGETLRHTAWRVGAAGSVELWPVVEPRPVDEAEPWEPPIRRVRGDDPQVRLASLLAERIRAMITTERLAARDRPIRPGDILVLVRRRTPFVEALVRNLKALDVPVAGADRMVLTEQLAVMDLIALANVLLLPEDNLTLAAVLKGPLIGLSEDDLFALAWERGPGQRLWEALRARASERRFAAAWATLSGLMALTDRMPPHDLFAHVLTGDGITGGGRARLLVRLGTEAEDAIDEFMALTLAYERLHPPSLQGFLAWVGGGSDDIKRDLDIESGAVRVMTVHGAKGLQAPIVILADTLQTPATVSLPLLWQGSRGDEIPLWAPRKEDRDALSLAAANDAEIARQREYRRLLYVAMTRAEDRLVVCGWRTRKPAPAGNWYELIERALSAAPGAESIEDDFFDARRETAGSTVIRLVAPQTEEPVRAPAATAAPAAAPMPDFLRRPPAPEPEPSRPLAPSRPWGPEPPVRSPFGGDDGRSYRRGRIIHRLLELLPELPPRRREAAMRRFLARARWGLDASVQAEIAGEVGRVLDDPTFAPLFGRGSRAEVAVAGMVGTRSVSGRIDRLAVSAGEVRIVDYKSDRPPPASPAEVPLPYLRQMAAYRALLNSIYPGRRIVCLLLWTDGPALMELPDAPLDAALSHLAPP